MSSFQFTMRIVFSLGKVLRIRNEFKYKSAQDSKILSLKDC